MNYIITKQDQPLNQCFYTETITTEKKKRSFVIVGSNIWDGLPVSLKNLNKHHFNPFNPSQLSTPNFSLHNTYKIRYLVIRK